MTTAAHAKEPLSTKSTGYEHIKKECFMRTNSLRLQNELKAFPLPLYMLLVFPLIIVSCSTKDHKTKQDEIQALLEIKTDSIYQIARSKYKISYRLDTLQDSYFRTTLFYQKNIKAGDYQLIQLEQYDISDIYMQDSTYYLIIWENSYSDLFVEVSFDPKNLQKFLDEELRAILIVNIDTVKKIHFELDSDVSESDPSTDYYAIDLNLVNSRKVLLKGSVKEIYFIE